MLQNAFRSVFFLFLIPLCVYSDHCNTEAIHQNIVREKGIKSGLKKCTTKLSYYIYIDDFINSMIMIQTTNVFDPSSTIASAYYAGRATLYNELDEKFGTCSASFLCMKNADGVFTDISNYLAVDNGLVISWLTPTTLINLVIDSIVHSMVTECIVEASTKIGFNPFYGEKFNMIVSSDDSKIYFILTEI